MIRLVRMVSYVPHVSKCQGADFMTSRSEIVLYIVHLGLNVSSSAYNCGYVVDGCNTMAAILVLLLTVGVQRSEGYSSCLVCVCVCLSAHAILAVRAIKSIMKDTIVASDLRQY